MHKVLLYGLRKLSSDKQTDRQTDRHTGRQSRPNTTRLRGWSKIEQINYCYFSVLLITCRYKTDDHRDNHHYNTDEYNEVSSEASCCIHY